ncbi:MAG: glycosyltransferase, partial [Planctomycetaceae bacterium]|nr:glycosyltransferase [Planctomycetaceae bacterium]
MNSPASISIIIPTLNEEENIDSFLRSLRSLSDEELQHCEIIIVDGGSSDQTVKLCDNADQLVRSKPGRAIQQNRGVSKSQGDILLFLHADCTLKPGGLTAIRNMMAANKHAAGCFRQQIDHPARKYRLLEWGNRMRVRLFGSA